MSNQMKVDKLDFWQNGRWYYYQTKRNEDQNLQTRAQSQSANIHIFPTTKKILNVMRDVKVGEIIKISGRLVNFKTPDGKLFKTSTSRNDTGSGSCEIIVVEELKIIKHQDRRKEIFFPIFDGFKLSL